MRSYREAHLYIRAIVYEKYRIVSIVVDVQYMGVYESLRRREFESGCTRALVQVGSRRRKHVRLMAYILVSLFA